MGRQKTMRSTFTALSRLVSSGMPLIDSFAMVADTTAGPIGLACRGVADKLRAGVDLETALKAYPEIFEPVHVATITIGEKQGNLDEALLYLTTLTEQRMERRKQLIKSVRYPLFLIFASFVILPLKELVVGDPSKYLTKLLINSGIVVGLIVIVLNLPAILKNLGLGAFARALAWNFPFAGSGYRNHVRGRFCSVLGRSIDAGLDMTASIEGASAAAIDERANKKGRALLKAIQGGAELAPAMASTRLVDTAELAELVAGERSGSLSTTLTQIGKRYEDAGLATLQRIMTIGAGLLMAYVFISIGASIVGQYSDIISGTERQIFEHVP